MELLNPVECSGTVLQNMNAECGLFTVDVVRKIGVGYAVLPAVNPAVANAKPVVVLVGGPGPSGVFQSGGFQDGGTFDFMRKDRRVILVDYRGVGLSEPFVTCSGEDFQECQNALNATSLNFEDFRSAVFAKDIDALLGALELDSVILWGGSYGTRLALTMMRDVPERISHVIIDGVFPIEVNGFSQGALAPLAGIEHAVQRCKIDAACTQKFGDLGPKVTSIAAKLSAFEEAPSLMSILGQLGYFNATPLLIDALSKLDSAEVKTTLEALQGTSYNDVRGKEDPGISGALAMRQESLPMTIGIVCSEEGPFVDQQPLDLSVYGFDKKVTDLFTDFLGGAPFPPSQAIRICADLGVKPAPAIELEPVESAMPTLVLSGGVDMQTSPIWGQQVADKLSASAHFVFPFNDHIATSGNRCAQSLMSQFIISADVSTLDKTCFDAIDRTLVLESTDLLKEFMFE